MDFTNKPIFGMIHLSGGDSETIRERALKEIDIYVEEGLDGCIIENYHGTVTDVMIVLRELSLIEKKNIKIGINILPNNYESAFEIASLYDVDFIQLDYISGNYIDTKSINEKNYLDTRYKYKNDPLVFGGVWPKYYSPIENSELKKDISGALLLCDGIVVTGSGTGKETPLDKIKEFKSHMISDRKFGNIPLIIGAGLDASNVVEQLKHADAAIVGSCFKPYKRTQEMISRELVREFMNEVKKIR